MSPDEISIVIADDHPIFRTGLREILEDERDLHIICECEDGEAAMDCIRSQRPDIAILDLEMPKMTGLDIAAIVQRDHIPTAIIMLTISDRVEIFNRAVEYGVVGYVLKDAAASDLVTGIRTILQGEYYFSPSLAVRSITQRRRHDETPHVTTGLSDLTPTERKVLGFIAEDKTSVEIARIMNISARTVDTHRSHISEKLGLHGAYTLVKFALQNKHLL